MSPRVRDGSGMSHLKGTPPQPKMQKNGQHFVWVMVVRCGEKSPHKPPMKGREPTMRKGSYSEELVKMVVATQVSEHLEVALSG